MRRLVWRAAARGDVAEIVSYIAQRDPAAARRMRDLFDAAVRHLPSHPFMYRPGRVPGTREVIAHPNYIVVYRVTETAVEVLAVLHTRQQYP